MMRQLSRRQLSHFLYPKGGMENDIAKVLNGELAKPKEKIYNERRKGNV